MEATPHREYILAWISYPLAGYFLNKCSRYVYILYTLFVGVNFDMSLQAYFDYLHVL